MNCVYHPTLLGIFAATPPPNEATRHVTKHVVCPSRNIAIEGHVYLL